MLEKCYNITLALLSNINFKPLLHPIVRARTSWLQRKTTLHVCKPTVQPVASPRLFFDLQVVTLLLVEFTCLHVQISTTPLPKVKVGVLRVQQPGSYWDRSSELPLVGLEPNR